MTPTRSVWSGVAGCLLVALASPSAWSASSSLLSWTPAPGGAHQTATSRLQQTTGEAVIGRSTSATMILTWGFVEVSAFRPAPPQTTTPPPTVTLILPTSGMTFTAPATVTFRATATASDGTIAVVVFFQGDKPLGVATTSPYEFVWSNVPIGTYQLKAKAVDSHNVNGTSQTVTIEVTTSSGSSNQPPTITLTSPATGAAFTAPAIITLTATASDADGSITKVEFFSGTTSLGTATTPPYQVSWTPSATGPYTLTAKATDNAGANRDSDPVTISVVNPPPPNTTPPPTTTPPTIVPPTTTPPESPTPSASSLTIAITSPKDGVVLGARSTNGRFSLFHEAILAAGGWTGNSTSTRVLSMVGDPIGLALPVILPGKVSTKSMVTTVEGTIRDPTASVTVNEIRATVTGTTFRAQGVALTHDGANLITATVTNQTGQSSSDTIILWKPGGHIPTITSLQPTDGSKLYVGVPTSIRVATNPDGQPMTCQTRFRNGHIIKDWGACDAVNWSPTDSQAGRVHTIEVHVRQQSGGQTAERTDVYVIHQSISPP